MSTKQVRSNDIRLEIVVVPVSDVDRAKEFYGRPGRRLDDAEFASGDDFRVIQLTKAFRRAEAAHGKYETRIGQGRDANWPEWYAAYMVAEQAGTELPS